eukprot:6208302-Amphidinium_carterae.1
MTTTATTATTLATSTTTTTTTTTTGWYNHLLDGWHLNGSAPPPALTLKPVSRDEQCACCAPAQLAVGEPAVAPELQAQISTLKRRLDDAQKSRPKELKLAQILGQGCEDEVDPLGVE